MRCVLTHCRMEPIPLFIRLLGKVQLKRSPGIKRLNRTAWIRPLDPLTLISSVFYVVQTKSLKTTVSVAIFVVYSFFRPRATVIWHRIFLLPTDSPYWSHISRVQYWEGKKSQSNWYEEKCSLTKRLSSTPEILAGRRRVPSGTSLLLFCLSKIITYKSLVKTLLIE